MVIKKEVMNVARLCRLQPYVIEKDYVLGWVLTGIYHHSSLKNSWIFKGGTSFHKCHYETYRFSEDLDFTIVEPSHLSRDFLIETFSEISEWVFEQAGLEIPKELLNFEIYTNALGSESCQGKIGYRGPIGSLKGYFSLPILKLDLTFDDVIVLPPVVRIIHHCYSDNPQGEPLIRCYPPEEAYAENICALAQHAKAQDLYDAINIFRSNEEHPNLSVLNDSIRKKCAHRGNPIPTLVDVQSKRKELECTWVPMLRHQVQELPPIESYFNALPEFFDWLESGAPPSLSAIEKMTAGEVVVREPTMSLPVKRTTQSYLESIRFAAVNYLYVDLQYKQSIHRIEPYSLRRTEDGDLVLHAISVTNGEHCRYEIDQIHGATITQQAFVPRYLVELRPKIQPS
ncbi:MAG: nucleotidyl transferase AbiEii/AbiGii toxin family protein [Rhodothermaceae bacterium]|nr:nucleotidyl transferase AbiEii/AbiGii toxin family protein [Rhodothermaceae bacterium]MYE64122.1 nucleotidyl transferase AbiEii/AbiGii toxin family protein [Rhodothermaceae bacterium]MYJ20915.1 nucleotidyl transferase AbiEii/AbiGii toxin family protein [Rhodothermaceae bacterium]